MGSVGAGGSRRVVRPVVVAVLALLAGALGAWGLARAGTNLRHHVVTVDGVPLTEVRATASDGLQPGVVVVHGFAGSSRLMTPLADTLARHGYVVVLVDLAGHGRSTVPLADVGSATTTERLAADLDTAVRYLRSRPGVDAQRIGLVGHSMGAGAVTRYAVGHPDIRATVAISLPSAEELPTGAAAPRTLLLLVGGVEFADFRQAADEAVRRAGPTADRRAVVVPGVEHISILFAVRTHAETASWLGRALSPSRPSGDVPARPLAYLVPAGLLVLGAVLGFWPLALALLSQSRGTTSRGPTPPYTAGKRVVPPHGRMLLVAVLVPVVAVLVARLLPFDRLPLAVGGDVAGFLAVTGLLLTCGAVVLGRSSTPGGPSAAPRGPGRRTQPWLAGVLLAAYAVAAVAVPLTLGFTRAVPAGDRWWLLPLVVASCWLFMVGAELLTGGGLVRAVPYAIAVLVLTAAALVGVAPGFVLLVVPLFGLLLAWQFGWSLVLDRLAAPAWLVALVGAVLVGWPVVTTLPLTG